MPELAARQPDQVSQVPTIFTIVGGTTIPDRAALVREHCREGSFVELRRDDPGRDDRDPSPIGVWLECRALLGLLKTHKKIGHVPQETAYTLLAIADVSPTVVAHGTVKTVYAPRDRDEAVVTVEIQPVLRRGAA
jgi:hypothetical protein